MKVSAIITFMVATVVSFSALARLTDNQVEFKVEAEQISLTCKKGFHFNAEAPASAVFDNLEAKFPPNPKTETLFVFRKNANVKTAKLSFYVCDDKKTVCEQHQQTLNLKSGEVKKTVEIKSQYDSIQNVKLASANGKATLLVFSAPWCPACIRMQTETYDKAAVKKELAKINMVKLNSDVADNYDLREKFGIRAIPSMILLDKDGNEVFRWLDYQPATTFAKSLSAEVKKSDQAAELQAKAAAGDPQAASALAFRALNALNYTEAQKWFELTKSEKDQRYKLATEVSLADEAAKADEKQMPAKLEALQKAIVLTTSQLDRIRWTIDYLSVRSDMKALTAESHAKGLAIAEEIEKLLAKKTEAAKVFAQSTYGEYGGFESEELLWLKGALYTVLEMKDEKAKTDQRTGELLKKRRLSVERPGELLLAIAYLNEAGQKDVVAGWHEKLTKRYPQSYVYFEKYARFEQKRKNFEKALGLINEALKYPEGNLPQLSLLKAQILSDMKKNSEALAVIDTALGLDYIQHKRFAQTRKNFEALKQQITR